jgi:ATP-dependent Clp protease ATP-binding subunit ClpA
MQRLIQDKIKKNLAESILFGDLSKSGGVVTVKLKDNDIKVSFSEHENRKVPVKPKK